MGRWVEEELVESGSRGVGRAWSSKSWLCRLESVVEEVVVVVATGDADEVPIVIVEEREWDKAEDKGAGVKGRLEDREEVGGKEGDEAEAMAASDSSFPGEGGTSSESRFELRVFFISWARSGRCSEKECEVGRTIAGGGLSEVVMEEEGEDERGEDVEGAVAEAEEEEEGGEEVKGEEGDVKRGVGISGIGWRSMEDGSQTLYGGIVVI